MSQGHFAIDRNGELRASRVHRDASGYVDRIDVVEGAYFSLLADADNDVAIDIETTDTSVVPTWNAGFGYLRWRTAPTIVPRLFGFARVPGASTLRYTQGTVSNGDSQVIVLVEERQASDPKTMSLTQLRGSTCAINAPDAKCYSGDTTLTCSGALASVNGLFSKVPIGTQHLMLAGHQVSRFVAGSNRAEDFSLGMGGSSVGAFKIDIDNVSAAFAKVADRLVANGVIWIGGCGLAENPQLCFAAAIASGKTVVAAGFALPNMTFPKSRVEMLARRFGAQAFLKDGTTRIPAVDFAALQDEHRFFLSPNA